MSIRKFTIAISLLLLSQVLSATAVSDTIKWMSIEDAMQAAEEKPKKIMVEVYTDWCVWCKKMDEQTFQDEYIAKYINENFYPVRFDAHQKEAIKFDGEVYKFVKSGNGGYHQLAAHLLKGRLSYPAIVFMDESSDLIQTITGYKSPMQFMQMITYFGEDRHRTTPWSTYKKSFVPKQMMIKHEDKDDH
jgi:thioredoxin-related protein